jgi:hypothetical protein
VKLRLDTNEKDVDQFIASFMTEERVWCKDNRMFQASYDNAACGNTNQK